MTALPAVPNPTTPLPTPAQAAAFMGWGPESADDLAPHLEAVTNLARAYVRGIGFTETHCEPELASVILSATARLAANPSNAVREEVGSWNTVPARFEGWTLIEQAMLHAYRRRTDGPRTSPYAYNR